KGKGGATICARRRPRHGRGFDRAASLAQKRNMPSPKEVPMRSAEDVIEFWFVEHGPEDWFGRDATFDAALAEQFSSTHSSVARGEAWGWRQTPQGRLAEIVVLDQFSRQLHRGSPLAFAQDCMALALAQEAVAAACDQNLAPERAAFFYMPYMHAESL